MSQDNIECDYLSFSKTKVFEETKDVIKNDSETFSKSVLKNISQ